MAIQPELEQLRQQRVAKPLEAAARVGSREEIVGVA
jgi:hypothetical protein